MSNEDQNPEMQIRELRDYCKRRNFQIIQEYVDQGISGSTNSRPALNQLIKASLKKSFQAVIVYRFDRFARSTKFLLETLSNFEALAIDFISLHEGIDTSTPTGRLLFTLIGAISEFERSLIKERVKSGLANAKAKGIRLGRPLVKINAHRVMALHYSGFSIRQIASQLSTSIGKIHSIIQKNKKK